MSLASKLVEYLPNWLHWPSRSTSRHVLIGILLGFSFSLSSTSFALYYQKKKRDREASHFSARPIELRSDEVVRGVTGLIGMWTLSIQPCNWVVVDCRSVVGNTPLMRINSLSDALGVEILGKAEVS